MSFLKKWFSAPAEPENLCSAVLVAAGSASRMQGIDKILHPFNGQPLLLHTLRPFQESELVDEIVVVTREELISEIGELVRQNGISKVTQVVRGGATRMESVQAGLSAVDPETSLIAIHDGARPFLTKELLEETIRAARKCSAAAPAVPVKDTVKRAKDGVVQETLPREELFAVQTPQIFDADLIRVALAKALENKETLTDDCGAVEKIGFPVHLISGSEENIKVTTPADLLRGEAILAEREGR